MMKTLWTPWRLEHVLGSAPKKDGCIFEPEGNSRSSKTELLLYRDTHTVVLLNRFPYANGHLLIAPSRHVGCITELRAEENHRLIDMVQKATAIVQKLFSPDGVNIGLNIGSAAGAGIADHLHYHLIPRWEGDHNFMAVIGEVRTIPEHIDATFDKLLPEFNTLT